MEKLRNRIKFVGMALQQEHAYVSLLCGITIMH